MPDTDYVQIARRAFAAINASCTSLQFLETPTDHVDINVEVPVQPGLAYEVNLNLQGDELHFSVGEGFWAEWFPCDDPDVEDRFVEAVVGFISGRYRIVETSAGGRPISARLERPSEDGWKTVTTWATMRFPWPWGRSERILRNGPGMAA